MPGENAVLSGNPSRFLGKKKKKDEKKSFAQKRKNRHVCREGKGIE